jgi:hypothetical protein
MAQLPQIANILVYILRKAKLTAGCVSYANVWASFPACRQQSMFHGRKTLATSGEIAATTMKSEVIYNVTASFRHVKIKKAGDMIVCYCNRIPGFFVFERLLCRLD